MAREKFKPVYNFMSTCDEKNNKNLPVPLKNTYHFYYNKKIS